MVSVTGDVVRPAVDLVQARMTDCGCRQLISRSNRRVADDADVFPLARTAVQKRGQSRDVTVT
jgi:hypothetical protein